jgi:uncharacterized protein (TIGR00106 family)
MKDHVIAEVSIVPLGTGKTSLSQYVAACVGLLEKEKTISYQLTPMGTIVEGALDKVLKVIMEMHEVPFEKGVMRVLTTIKIDDRRDKKITMDSKIKSVLKTNPRIKIAR